MKTIEERKMQKKQQKKIKQRQKRARGTVTIVKGWELNDFVVIFKSSLICKTKLELALSVTLKQKKLYQSKHVVEECRCLKIWDL